jgi:hypothetical protein
LDHARLGDTTRAAANLFDYCAAALDRRVDFLTARRVAEVLRLRWHDTLKLLRMLSRVSPGRYTPPAWHTH